MGLTLRPYQRNAIDSLYAYWRDGNAGPALIVAPTGAGKSVIMAEFIREIQEDWPGTRILILTHVRELVLQDYLELLEQWPDAPAGIFSAGLKRRDLHAPVLFASIQSIDRHAHKLDPPPEVVIIDEAHLIPRSSDTRYRKTLELLRMMYPNLRVVGLTATPYRLDSGWLHTGKDALFEQIVYDIPVQMLIDEGHLSPITTKAGAVTIDTTGVAHTGREFRAGDLERRAMEGDTTRQAVADMVARAEGRKKWIVFAAGVAHAHQIADALDEHGVACAVITGGMKTSERDKLIHKYRTGSITALVNVNVLTTGFNVPSTDMISLMRPTESPGLYCLSLDTEVLTSHGWLGPNEMQEGYVAPALDMNTGAGKWARVEKVIRRTKYDNESWIQYDAPRCHFKVTDNHRMIFSTKKYDKSWSEWKIDTAFNMQKHKDSIRIPTAIHMDQKGVPLTDDELYLIGIIMSDGTITTHQVTIYQSAKYPEVMSNIEHSLDACNIAYKKTRIKAATNYQENFPRYRYSVSVGDPRSQKNKIGMRYLMPYLHKDLSPLLMQLSEVQFEKLLDGIWDGDGTKKANVDYQPRSKEIVTAREKETGRLQALGVMNGYTVHLREEHKNRATPLYIMTFTKQDWRSIGGTGNRPQVMQAPMVADEEVWCVQTETGTIVTRKDGKVTVMGNCQAVGRGMRTAPGKTDCLVLDYAGNAMRHGPIDAVVIKDKGEGDGIAPAKECPECHAIIAAGLRHCPYCGHEFPPPEIRIAATHKEAPLLKSQIEPEWVSVDSVDMFVHKKPGKPDSVRLEYMCGMMTYKEWIFPEAPSERASYFFVKWCREAGITEPPRTAAEFVEIDAPVPRRIAVMPDGKYIRVTRRDYGNV